MSRASIRIRPAEHADVDRLVTLITTAGTAPTVFGPRRSTSTAMSTASGAELAQRLDDLLAADTRTLLIAVDDETSSAVGMLVAKPDEIGSLDLTAVLHITHLVVAPKLRRHGIGRALLAGAVHLAEEQGAECVLATVASGSRESNRYLARLGFAPHVVARVASTAALRRTLGLADTAERMAVLRRARLVRAHRGVSARGA